jgi:hypothetical protein
VASGEWRVASGEWRVVGSGKKASVWDFFQHEFDILFFSVISVLAVDKITG